MLQRYGRMFYLLGVWGGLSVVLSLIPAWAAMRLGDHETAAAFLSSAAIGAFIASTLIIGFHGSPPRRTMRGLVLLPVLGICSLAIMAGLPQFLLAEDPDLALLFFEGMSSITTTAVYAFADPEHQTYPVLLWKALLAWMGGFGAVVLSITIANHLNVGGLRLHRSPVHNADVDQGHARLSATASTLLPLYAGLTFAFFLCFWFASGDAGSGLILALGAMATAGVSPQVDGGFIMGGTVQVVALVAMLIAGLNLDYHYAWWRGRRRIYGQDGESQGYLRFVLLGFITLLVIGLITGDGDESFLTQAWHSLFLAVSAISTTGWVPDHMHGGGSLALSLAAIALACIGGSVTSTGGGVKVMRVIILIRHGARELARLAHPHGVSRLRFAGETVGERDLQAVWLLLAGFVFSLLGGTLLLAVSGLGFKISFLLAITALTTSGPLVYFADPSFAGYNGLLVSDYMVLSTLMLIGRLEISLFLALFASAVWRR